MGLPSGPQSTALKLEGGQWSCTFLRNLRHLAAHGFFLTWRSPLQVEPTETDSKIKSMPPPNLKADVSACLWNDSSSRGSLCSALALHFSSHQSALHLQELTASSHSSASVISDRAAHQTLEGIKKDLCAGIRQHPLFRSKEFHNTLSEWHLLQKLPPQKGQASR